MHNSTAPIAVFAFNRPDHLQRTLQALAANTLASQSPITIFCDGPRHDEEKSKTDAVREVAKTAKGFASVRVIARESNMGCATSVITGLQEMFAEHEKLIIIEDDILCSPHTLTFLNEGLTRYADMKTVFNVSAWSAPGKIFPLPEGYAYDVYAVPRLSGWGWATWRDRWGLVDWQMQDYKTFKSSPFMREAFNRGGQDMSDMLDAQMSGCIDAWDIRMDYARFKHGCVGINPVISYTTNIGMGCGTHTTEFSDRLDNDISRALPVENVRWLEHVFVDETIRRRFVAVYEHPNCIRRYLRRVLQAMGILPYAQKCKRWLRCK